MARSVYRVYLYVVTCSMLIFGAVGVYLLLSVLLAQTGLRGDQAPPSSQEVVQRFVFVVVTLVIAGGLGGLHYWLIRRDIQHESTAASSAVRSFFLNLVEAIAVIVAVFTAASSLMSLGFGPTSVADPFAAALAALLVAGAVEWERRRSTPAPGVATIFQRLHLYGVPLFIAVIVGSSIWQPAISNTIGQVLYTAGQFPACPAPGSMASPQGPCFGVANIWLQWSAAALVAVAWGGYVWLARGDMRSGLRQVTHLLGFAFGLIMLVLGVERGVEWGLRALLQVPVNLLDLVTSYEFVSSLVFGLVVLAAYGVLVRREAALLPMGETAVGLTTLALAAFILAVPFWWGIGYTVHDVVERLTPGAVPPTSEGWAFGLALIIAGASYIPLALLLRTRTARTTVTTPRRGFVLGMLGGGALTGAAGAAIALYALGTALLSAPLADWQAVARTGGVVLLTGAIIAGIYGWVAAQEHAFARPAGPKPPTEGKPFVVALPTSIEGVLDAFKAGTMTREEAAKRIHELDESHMLPA
jgi:hypothetical protein